MKIPFNFFPELLTNIFSLEKPEEGEVAGYSETAGHENYRSASTHTKHTFLSKKSRIQELWEH